MDLLRCGLKTVPSHIRQAESLDRGQAGTLECTVCDMISAFVSPYMVPVRRRLLSCYSLSNDPAANMSVVNKHIRPCDFVSH